MYGKIGEIKKLQKNKKKSLHFVFLSYIIHIVDAGKTNAETNKRR